MGTKFLISAPAAGVPSLYITFMLTMIMKTNPSKNLKIAIAAILLSAISFVWQVYTHFDARDEKVTVRSMFLQGSGGLLFNTNVTNSGQTDLYLVIVNLIFFDDEGNIINNLSLNKGSKLNVPIKPGQIKIYSKLLPLHTLKKADDLKLIISSTESEIYSERFNLDEVRKLYRQYSVF